MHIFGMITTKASAHYTEHALKSFYQHTVLGPDDLFVLVDNDGSWDQQLEHPSFRLIKNPRPLGFAENVNQFVHMALSAKADLVLLNNDLIFSPDWLSPLVASAGVTSPLSNRELQYQADVITTTMIMELKDYLGKEDGFLRLVEAHKKRSQGEYKVLALPFFCVRLPNAVLKSVGEFDESFGKGGAEDYDYCLRAILAGFNVHYCLGSYVIHFGGKSSWSGAETKAEQDAREERFRSVFGLKWGADLLNILLFEDRELLAPETVLGTEVIKGNHRSVVESLIQNRTIKVKLP